MPSNAFAGAAGFPMFMKSKVARQNILAVALCSTVLLAGCDSKSSSEDRAGSGKGGGVVRSSCKLEIERLCFGEARPGQCLRSHKDELSATCKAAIADRDNQK